MSDWAIQVGEGGLVALRASVLRASGRQSGRLRAGSRTRSAQTSFDPGPRRRARSTRPPDSSSLEEAAGSDKLLSPAIALVDGDRILLGRDAEARARLRPKQVHRRFWTDLSTDPLPPVFPAGWRVADLAHAHLEATWEEARDRASKETGREPERVFLALPGAWTPEQVGLAIGIARSIEIPVVGVVDSALAALVDWAENGDEESIVERVVHLDVGPYRATATHFERRDSLWSRARVEIADVGLVPLHDAWARAVDTAFVRATRFEPFHFPETEQDLYDRLPEWLAALDDHESGGRETIEASLDRPGRPDEPVFVEIDRDAMLAAVEDRYDVLERLVDRAGEGSTVLLSAASASLPGLARRIGARCLVGGARVLDEEASARGALVAADRLVPADGALRFVVRLPAGDTVGDTVGDAVGDELGEAGDGA